MADFLKRLGLLDRKLPVGFTFSFPCKQEGLDHVNIPNQLDNNLPNTFTLYVCDLQGTLITWTKGFTASGVVGQDIVKMLREAIERRGVSIYVVLFSFYNLTIYEHLLHKMCSKTVM